jgi:hypothetical protein
LIEGSRVVKEVNGNLALGIVYEVLNSIKRGPMLLELGWLAIARKLRFGQARQPASAQRRMPSASVINDN